MPITTPAVPPPPAVARPKPMRVVKKVLKRVIPLAVGITLGIFFPVVGYCLLAYVACGLLDVLRNRGLKWSTIDRYFAGNGVFTWLLAPFNLFLDLLCLPYWNRGVYKLNDLPAGHRAEIQTLIDAARARNLIGLLDAKLGDNKRGMIFFKWYGKDIPGTVDMPEYHANFKHLRTVGVSIFNKKQSTGKHYGPLRVTLRVLYNLNPVDDPNVYIEVGDKVHRWREEPLFIFDDTLQHQSVNESDAVRYCLFVDILRPSPLRPVLDAILTCVRWVMAPVRRVFYGHWTVIK